MKFKIKFIEDYCYRKAVEVKDIYEKVYGWGFGETEEKAIEQFNESLKYEYSKLPQSERKIVEKYIPVWYQLIEKTDDDDEIIGYVAHHSMPRTSDVMFGILPMYWNIKFFFQKLRKLLKKVD